jgi:hypothetical protein
MTAVCDHSLVPQEQPRALEASSGLVTARYGDLCVPGANGYLERKAIRLFAVEIRAQCADLPQEELAMLPCDIILPYPAQSYGYHRINFPITLHTTVGDVGMQGAIG